MSQKSDALAVPVDVTMRGRRSLVFRQCRFWPRRCSSGAL